MEDAPMTQLLTPAAPKRLGSRPLDGTRALQAAAELAKEAAAAIAECPENFERALALIETVAARFRSAFLTQTSREAEAALAYHDRAVEELEADFSPLYYRRAVLENVVARYERSAGSLMRALA
jgi:hypothetical protein